MPTRGRVGASLQSDSVQTALPCLATLRAIPLAPLLLTEMFPSPGDPLFHGISPLPLSPHDWYFIFFVWGEPKGPTVWVPDVVPSERHRDSDGFSALAAALPPFPPTHIVLCWGGTPAPASTQAAPPCPAQHSEVAP